MDKRPWGVNNPPGEGLRSTGSHGETRSHREVQVDAQPGRRMDRHQMAQGDPQTQKIGGTGGPGEVQTHNKTDKQVKAHGDCQTQKMGGMGDPEQVQAATETQAATKHRQTHN